MKPETGRLRLLVRVPLEAIRDVDFPQRGAGYLDIARTTPLLRDAANVWIADYVEMYENDRRLERGGIVATRVSLPSDRSFATYDGALANVTGPPLADTVDAALAAGHARRAAGVSDHVTDGALLDPTGARAPRDPDDDGPAIRAA